MPVIIGVLNPFSKGRIQHSMLSIVNGVNFIVGFILSGYLIGLIFSDTKNELLQFLENHVPSAITLIKEYHHDIVAYIIAMFLLMSVIFFILKLLAIPFYRYAITPAAGKISSALDSAHPAVRRLFGGIWQLPKSIWMVLVFAMLLNFYTSFINNPAAGDYISASGAYQTIRSHMLQPILSADAVKKMPVLVSDAFRKAAEDFTPANSDNVGTPNYWKLPAIKYFNGMTIDEAVKSNSEIDSMAQKIVGDEQKDREKAFLLYKWVSRNIRYDNAKAAIILESPSHVNSGSIVTFDERTGVCFDYSCLYVSMCRAAGLKVRLISGLGYSGEEWGEHVWNQVYDPAEDRWINVDTTFGNSGYDYFDNTSFSSTHKYDVVQAEW
jgi:Transglutaminase-like enzymes, putative cysteine proteases